MALDTVINTTATEAGFGDVVMDKYVVGGATFQNHYNDASFWFKVNSQNWTHYVLQGYSQEAYPSSAGHASFLEYGRKIAQDIYAINPDARIYLYSTPAYNEINNVAGNGNIYPTFAPDEPTMATGNMEGYTNLRDLIRQDNPSAPPCQVAYVTGIIHAVGGGLNPNNPSWIETQETDGLHWEDTGRMLAAWTIFVAMTGRDVTAYASDIITALSQSVVISPPELFQLAYRWTKFSKRPVLITVHPEDTSLNPGESTTLSIEAEGSGTLTYQWYKNDVSINGATSTSLNIGTVSESNDGDEYYCLVTNSEGFKQSDTATISVQVTIVPVYVNLTRNSGNDINYPADDDVRWNNIRAISDSDIGTVNTTWALIDANGDASGITLRLLGEGTGCNAAGATGILGLPNYATQVSWIGDGVANNQWRYEGLTPGKLYRFETGGFRNSGTTRTTRHSWTGATSGTTDYNAGTNLSALAYYDVAADSNGYVTITASNVAPSDLAFHYTSLFIISTPP
jgi:hypothetical protein